MFHSPPRILSPEPSSCRIGRYTIAMAVEISVDNTKYGGSCATLLNIPFPECRAQPIALLVIVYEESFARASTLSPFLRYLLRMPARPRLFKVSKLLWGRRIIYFFFLSSLIQLSRYLSYIRSLS